MITHKKTKTFFLILLILLLVTCSPSERNSSNNQAKGKDNYLPVPPPPPSMAQPDSFDYVVHEMRSAKATSSSVQSEENEADGTSVIKKESAKKHNLVKAKKPISEIKPHNSGLLAYDIPDTMEYRKWYTVHFRINRNTGDTSLITSNIKPDKIEIHAVKTSNIMEVNITDPQDAFKIVKSNSDKQSVDTAADYTEWVYDIFPLKSGKHPLHIVVSTVVDGVDKDIVYIRDVQIKTPLVRSISYNAGTFFSKYWQWIMSTLIIPFVIWFYNKRKKKDK